MKKRVVSKVVFPSLFFIFISFPSYARTLNILVQPFQNTGDAQYSWISAGMTDTVISDLNKIRDINVISDKDRKKVLEELKFTRSGLVDEEGMVKVGKLAGANIIFTGSYQVSGNRLRVNAKLINVESGKVETSTKLDGTVDRIFDLQDKVVFSLVGDTEKIRIADIGPVKLVAEDKKKIEEKYKPKTEAYEWYSKGLEVENKNPKLALDYFNSAIKIDPDYTQPLMWAGVVAGDSLNLFTEAQNYLQKADNIFKSRGETASSDYSNLIGVIGALYSSKGQLDLALKYYLGSQAIKDRLGLQNTDSYSDLVMNIGLVYWSKGQLDTALKYYLDSQAIKDRLGLQNTDSYSDLVGNIGFVYLDKGDLDLALKYAFDSQSIRDRLGLQNTVAYSILVNNIGRIYHNKGQLDWALKYYLDSQAIKDRLGLQNTADYSSVMTNIALVYSSKGQLDLALKYSLDAQAIMERLGLQDTVSYSNIMTNIGVVYWSKGQPSSALKYYLDSQAIKDRLGLQNTVAYGNNLFNLALAYERQGQLNMAGRCFRMAHETYIRADYWGPNKDNALNNAQRLGY
jgi:TolB-like protein